MKRRVSLAVISDVHLGTYGSKAKELSEYLDSIQPDSLVVNGDLIDIWQFSRRYWPKAHMQVVKQLLGLISEGTRVIYITGNHDELMRKFAGFKLDNFEICNQAVLPLDGKQAWLFHGDVFDSAMQHARWIARLGANGYGLLILLNKAVNWCSRMMGRKPVSFSKRIKNAVKSKHKFVQTAGSIAAEKGYDFVVCGHVHRPEMRVVSTEHKKVLYLNSGDWVENMTALEYHNGEWQLYRHEQDFVPASTPAPVATTPTMEELSAHWLFRSLLSEFDIA